MRALVLAALLACGGPQPPATPPAPTCERTAGALIELVAAGHDPRPPDDTIARLVGELRGHCERTAWSPEARTCLAAVKTAEDVARCSELLSDAQQAALAPPQ